MQSNGSAAKDGKLVDLAPHPDAGASGRRAARSGQHGDLTASVVDVVKLDWVLPMFPANSVTYVPGCASRRLATLGHVRAQDGVDSGLISWPLRFEPVQDIGIDTKGDRLLRRRLDHRRVIPEILRELRQLSGRRRPDFAFGHSPQLGQVSAAAENSVTSRRPFCTLHAHGGHSSWLK